MPRWFPCPYLNEDVELTYEREAHVRTSHELVLLDDLRLIVTLEDPDEIHRSKNDPQARLFLR
jgi:hypothetical protein